MFWSRPGSDDKSIRRRLTAIEDNLDELSSLVSELRSSYRSLQAKYAVSSRDKAKSTGEVDYRKLCGKLLGGEIMAVMSKEELSDGGKVESG